MALIGGGFSNYVNNLFNNPELSDVAIVLDNDEEKGDTSTETKTFHGHRVILATMSDYFRSMLYGSFVEASKKEIRLPGVPYSTFLKVMKFVYLGITLPSAGTLEKAVEFYSLARMLLVDSKMKFSFGTWMLDQMETKESWKEDLPKIFALALEWDILRVASKCNSNFIEIANEYLANSSFLELPLEAVKMILNNSNICCTRTELKDAIQAWIAHNKGEITADVVGKLNERVSKFGKLCYDFKVLSLCQKKNQPKPKMVQSNEECSESEDALMEPHEYSYVTDMNILKCFSLRGIKICLRTNPKFGPQHGRIKSELELSFKMEYQGNEYRRNITVRYDFTRHEQQSVTIFFPEMICCKDGILAFHISWKGTGAQPLLLNYGPARSNRMIESCFTFVTHIICEDKDCDSDGRCSECSVPDDCDWYSMSSNYHDDSGSEMETETSEDRSDED